MQRSTSFKKVVLCHTNDFKPEINDKIKGWVEANGAIFSKELTPNVTHLVASKKAWKRYHPLVKEARRTQTVRIVGYDWLEDSLLQKPIKALPVDKYLFEQFKFKPTKKAPTARATSTKTDDSYQKKTTIPRDKRIELTGIEFDKARQEFEQDMGTAGFHPYSDRTGFVYVITLLRYDILKTRFEKYRLKVGHDPHSIPYDVVPQIYTKLHLFPAPEPFSTAPITGVKIPAYIKRSSRIHIAEPWAQCLQLYESDGEPHTYACYTQYTRAGTQRQMLVLAPPGSTWEFTWSMFQNWFLRKVGTSWNERSQSGIEINLDGENEPPWFQYQAPKVGEPEGLRELDRGAGQTMSEPAVENNDEENDDGNDELLEQEENSVRSEVVSEAGDAHLP